MIGAADLNDMMSEYVEAENTTSQLSVPQIWPPMIWFFWLNPMTMLVFESQKVIELRLVRLAWGGREGRDEAKSMVTEKIDAAFEAAGTLMSGGSVETVVSRYREHVAANTKRLARRA